MFYFTDSFRHSINVKLNRDKSPRTGIFDFAVPVRVSYQNRNGKWTEFLRAVKRPIEVLPRKATIPTHPEAKERKKIEFKQYDKTKKQLRKKKHLQERSH